LRDTLVNSDQYLLKSVAEEIRSPLVQISRLSELARDGKSNVFEQLEMIESSADIALQLLESYILGIELDDKQREIELSPITIGAVFSDVAHDVSRLAKNNNFDIEMSIKTQKPIMGNYEAIKLAYINIAHEIILNCSLEDNQKRKNITFAVISKSDQSMAGIYANNMDINKATWEKSMQIFRKTRQKIPDFSSGNGSGFFVASSILESMSLTLGPSKFKGNKGLSAAFPLSHQLSLV